MSKSEYKIKINSLNFKIIEVDEIEKTNNDDGQIIGYTDYINQKILLLKTLSFEQKINTLRHELTHAFLWAYGLSAICEKLPLEVVCDFVGIYSGEIVEITNKYIKEVLANE